MDLKAFLEVLVRRKWIILLTVAAALGLTALGTSLQEERYTAKATLRLATAVSGSVSSVDYEITYADRLMNTYGEIAGSRPLLDTVAERLELRDLPDISVSIPTNTELLKVSATAGSADAAADIANAVADELISRGSELLDDNTGATLEALQSQVAAAEAALVEARSEYEAAAAQFAPESPIVLNAQNRLDETQVSYASSLEQYNQALSRRAIQSVALTVIEPAIPPSGPSEPRVRLNLALGLVAGLAAAVGLAVVAENFDSTLDTVADIEALSDSPVVGMIPLTNRGQFPFRRPARAKDVLGADYPHDEAFHRLRIAIGAASEERRIGVVLVTSSGEGEGKSMIVAKLAQSFANIGLSVMAVDANSHSPSLDTLLESDGVIGLFSSLEDGFDASKGARPTSIRGVDLIASGEASAQAADLLGIPSMEQLLKELKTEYDVVLVDTPGLLSVADAAVLAPLADGVLFVVDRGHTKRESAEAGLRQLAAARAKLVGIVANGAHLAD